MAFFNEYPYTDFHELNLDWILKTIESVVEEWHTVQQEWTSVEAAWLDLKDYVENYFENLDVQEEINNKLDEMAADGTLDAILLPYFNQYKHEINQAIADQNAEIAVLNSRMDTFSHLSEGSTTGDAELMDIRVGSDGTIYPTAGDAVRGQVDILQNEDNINDLRFTKSVNLLNPNDYKTGGYYNGSGEWITNASIDTSNLIPTTSGDVFYFQYLGTRATTACYFDASETFISRTTGLNGNSAITTPSNNDIAYVRVTFANDFSDYSLLMFSKDIRPTRFMAYSDVELSKFSLQNRKIAILGDSITATESRWVKQFVNRLKPQDVNNLAVTGAHLRDYYNTPYPYDGNPSSSDQISNVLGNQVQKLINGISSSLYDTPDIIFIMIGSNDNWDYEDGHDIEEEFTDGDHYISLTDVTRYRYAGAMRWALETIRTVSADCKVIFITPIQCAQDIETYDIQKKRADRIIEVSKRMSLEYFDAFNESGIYGRYEHDGSAGPWLADGIHPNTSGGVKLGNYIADKYQRLQLSQYYSSVASWA